MRRLLQRIVGAAAALSGLSLLASCVAYSLHPLYDAKSSVFEPSLVGTWVDPMQNNKPTMKFEKLGENAYTVTAIEFDGNPPYDAIFEAHAVKLGGRLFLDAVNTKNRAKGIEMNAGMAIPSHLIGRVTVDGDTLHLDLLSDSWLEDGFKTGRITIAHELVDDSADSDVLLTASTAELQKFVADHANDDNAFPPSDPLKRLK